jgi:Domain of unknown function (DUF4124)
MKFLKTMTPYAITPYFIAIFSLVFSASAMAQYVWLDAAGRKVFSDQPPPSSIPAKRVLQQPGKPSMSSSNSTSANNDSATKAEEDDPANPKTQAKAAAKEAAEKASGIVKKSAEKDKDLEAAKKKLDLEAAAKKKTEEEAREASKADNCSRAKQAKMTLDSGLKIGTVNAKGEKTVMDDAARTVETKRIEGIMAADCK